MAGYIKIGDIKGECIDAEHKGWVNLLSVSQGMSRPVKAGHSGSTRQRASVDVGDLVCVKEMDASSPKLQQAICTGKNYPEVELHLVTSVGGEKREKYYQIKLYNAVVVSYDVSGSTADGAVPTDSFSLNFEKIEWTYYCRGQNFAGSGQIDASWKVGEGTA